MSEQKHPSEDCPIKGYTAARKAISDAVSKLLSELCLIAQCCEKDGHAAEAQLCRDFTTALCDRAPRLHWPPCVQHDAIDRFHAEKKLIMLLGFDERWGFCPDCDVIIETKQ